MWSYDGNSVRHLNGREEGRVGFVRKIGEERSTGGSIRSRRAKRLGNGEVVRIHQAIELLPFIASN